MVESAFWVRVAGGSNPLTPTHKNHFMKMNQEIEKLPSFTIEEFQADFDNGNAVMVPYKEVVSICNEAKVDFEEIVKIHTDHEEGS